MDAQHRSRVITPDEFKRISDVIGNLWRIAYMYGRQDSEQIFSADHLCMATVLGVALALGMMTGEPS